MDSVKRDIERPGVNKRMAEDRDRWRRKRLSDVGSNPRGGEEEEQNVSKNRDTIVSKVRLHDIRILRRDIFELWPCCPTPRNVPSPLSTYVLYVYKH